MEGKKQVGSSSSSFTDDLFGSPQSFSSSSNYFDSIFGPSSKRSEVMGKKSETPNEAWNSKSGEVAGDTYKSVEGEIKKVVNKDMSTNYEEQRAYPCNLSSSIFYGGQDDYYIPQKYQNSTMDRKNSDEDDSGAVSRGNWWKGSLYY